MFDLHCIILNTTFHIQNKFYAGQDILNRVLMLPKIQKFFLHLFVRIEQNRIPNIFIMKLCLVLILLVVTSYTQTLNNLPGVPQQLIDQANQALQKATPQLQRYNLKNYSKIALHRTIKAAIVKLFQVKKALDSENLVIGDNNVVKGKNNIIVGSDNKINGNNNWLISVTQYKGQVDQTLIYRDWQIKMGFVDAILIKPSLVIRILNEEEKSNFLEFFSKLSNLKGDYKASNLFWGLTDKQNKLILAANHLAQIRQNQDQSQNNRFFSDNKLVTGSKYLQFQGLNTRKMLSSLGLRGPDFLKQADQTKETARNNEDNNIQQISNSESVGKNPNLKEQVKDIYSSGLNTYNSIESTLNSYSRNSASNDNSASKDNNKKENGQGFFYNSIRNWI